MRFTTALDVADDAAVRIALIQGGSVCEVLERDLMPAFSATVHFVDSVSSRGKRILTLTGSGAHKGVALTEACRDLGLEPADVVAFGDSDNDLEMFRVAGASVAMGQAGDHLKEAATFVTAPNSEDGVAVAIEHLLATGDLKKTA